MLNPSVDRCLAYRRKNAGLYVQEYEKVGRSRIGDRIPPMRLDRRVAVHNDLAEIHCAVQELVADP